jgi:hypothetical protein
MAEELKYQRFINGKPFDVIAPTKTTRYFKIPVYDIKSDQADAISNYINNDSNTKDRCRYLIEVDKATNTNYYYFKFSVKKSRVGLENKVYQTIVLYLSGANTSITTAPPPKTSTSPTPAAPKTIILPITGTIIKNNIKDPTQFYFELPFYDQTSYDELVNDIVLGTGGIFAIDTARNIGNKIINISFREIDPTTQAQLKKDYETLDRLIEGYLAYKNAPAAAQPATAQMNAANLDGIKLGQVYYLMPITEVQVYKEDVFNVPIYSFYLTGGQNILKICNEIVSFINTYTAFGLAAKSTLLKANPDLYKIEFEIVSSKLNDEESTFNYVDEKLYRLGYKNPFTSAAPTKALVQTQSDLLGIETEVEKLKTELDQLVFLRSLNSELEFEKNIEIGQKIANVKEKINELNFSKLEAKLTIDDIFDQLFEQSFTPIQHVYSNLKVTKEEEGDFFTPNGKPSELSEQLNELIRTQQFKDWFGDWQLTYMYKQAGDTDTDCSVVLTENFEPKLFYHGTGQEFSYFKFDKFPAAYFAANQAYSQWFANLHGGDKGYTIPFFLNVRNPLDLTQFGTEEIRPKDFFDYMYLQTGLDAEQLEVNPLFLNPSAPARECWVYLRNNPKMLKKLADNQVYDGIHFYETNPGVDKGLPAYKTEVYITFKAEQCKIADNDRGLILMASLKSFLLKEGGKI